MTYILAFQNLTQFFIHCVRRLGQQHAVPPFQTVRPTVTGHLITSIHRQGSEFVSRTLTRADPRLLAGRPLHPRSLPRLPILARQRHSHGPIRQLFGVQEELSQ
jgi:hypothetical protein